MGIIFWVLIVVCFPLALLYLIKKELPRLFPIHNNLLLTISFFLVAAALYIFAYRFTQDYFNLGILACSILFFLGYLFKLPPRLVPWRDILFSLFLGIALFYPTLADAIPSGMDMWSKPYYARSAAQSILSLTEPGWDIGWFFGFDYTIYGAFSPVYSGLMSVISGDHFLGVRIEVYTALIFLPPLAYLMGRRVGRNRWGGFVALVVLMSSRLFIGYLGISRFWAVPLLPALWLALSGWRDGKRGYAALVTYIMACALFIHAQVGVMALLLFSGFTFEFLWRRRKGILLSWLGIVIGFISLTAIFWQNYLQAQKILVCAPDLFPYQPEGFHHAFSLSLSILCQMIDPFIIYRLLPDIYTHVWYLGATTVLLGLFGLIVWSCMKRDHFGIFPALWSGTWAVLFNLPILYTVPVLGNLIQNFIFPSFTGDSYDTISVGLHHRYLILSLLALGIISAKLPSLVKKISLPMIMKRLPQQFIMVLLTFILLENLPLWQAYNYHLLSTDPRKSENVMALIRYLNSLPASDRIYYNPKIDYGGILNSSLHRIPLLNGWIACGFNYTFTSNILWYFEEIIEKDPQFTAERLAAIGVNHIILSDKNEIPKDETNPMSLTYISRGTFSIENIPAKYSYLYPGKIINITDKSQIDLTNWEKTPWKIYRLSDYSVLTSEDDIEPDVEFKQESFRRAPNRIEINYTVGETDPISINLTYQPNLMALVDGQETKLNQNLINGFAWFESSAGKHRLVLYRARGTTGWLALILSFMGLLAIIYCGLGIPKRCHKK